MIFITVGTRPYQFNRLLKEIDTLIEKELIKEIVFAQIGFSDYKPKYYDFVRLLSPEEFSFYQNKASFIITHGGAGSVISALKKRKKVISVPRLAEFNEHIDNHQKQISDILKEMNYIETVNNIDDLSNVILRLVGNTYDEFKIESKIIYLINNFINNK